MAVYACVNGDICLKDVDTMRRTDYQLSEYHCIQMNNAKAFGGNNGLDGMVAVVGEHQDALRTDGQDAQQSAVRGAPDTLDYSWRNVTDSALPTAHIEVKQQLQDGKHYFLDLRGNRLSLEGLEKVITLLLDNKDVDADLSCNSFGFADAYRTLERRDALHLIKQGRLTFDPRGDKAVELLAARLIDTKGHLNDLQEHVVTMGKRKDGFAKEWSGWKQVESDAVEVQVSKAVSRYLDEGTGKVVLTSYRWKGTSGDLDGLVIGNLDGLAVYVLVEAKHNVDANRRKAAAQLKHNSQYINETLLSPNVDEDAGESDLEDWTADREAVQADKLHGRNPFWAFGGIQFKQPDKLQMKGKCCLMVQPNHDMQYEVVRVEKDDVDS